MLRLILGCYAFILAQPCASAMDKTEPIDTNRPSFMSSPLVVPRSSIQFESGSTYQRSSGGEWQLGLPEAQFRIGITEKTEFQFFAPNFRLIKNNILTATQQAQVIFLNNNEPLAEVGNLSEIGLKHQFTLPADAGFLSPLLKRSNCALIVSVTAPTGTPAVRQIAPEGAIRLPWTVQLNERWSVGGMQSLLLQERAEFLQWQPDFLVSRSVGKGGSVFLEFGGFYTTRNKPLNLLHTGFTLKRHNRHQIDTHFGLGLNETAPIFFVGAGYSYRFDRLDW